MRRFVAPCLVLVLLTVGRWAQPAESADTAYLQARAAYHDLLRSAEKKKSTASLKKAIGLYEAFAAGYPQHHKSPDALYNIGRLYESLFKVTHDPGNVRAGIGAFDQLVRTAPKSNLADDCLFHAARYYEDYLKRSDVARQYRDAIRKAYPDGDMVALLVTEAKGRDASEAPATVIVIDPGHGGDDPGAIGVGGLQEKEVVLKISRQLKKELEGRHHYKVYLTRHRDQTLSLDDRNKMVAKKSADLFVSIHANASTSPKVFGVQTYYLNNASDEASRRLAARENSGREKSVSNVKGILASLVQNDVTEESALLARGIHRKILAGVGEQYKGGRDLKVKTALFYVLVGAKVPSVLIETAFITNPQEAARLKSQKYQKVLAKAIADGLDVYLEKRAQELKDL